ncbi:unnamed protein product, partial [Amoebophrya sp. A25]|eukprot:GSA25T00026322001.1
MIQFARLLALLEEQVWNVGDGLGCSDNFRLRALPWLHYHEPAEVDGHRGTSPDEEEFRESTTSNRGQASSSSPRPVSSSQNRNHDHEVEEALASDVEIVDDPVSSNKQPEDVEALWEQEWAQVSVSRMPAI